MNLLFFDFNKKTVLIENQEINPEKNISEKINNENIVIKETTKEEANFEELNWYIEIASINLKAPICESTKMDVLNKYVGHFEDTPKKEGNIGLAGHNKGFEKNYFQDLYKLKKGDEIKYKYNDYEKIYSVEKIKIIKNTNWSYLENTSESKITLITCVENKPDLRLCIQAIQK